jgi:hypothetical protein
MVDRRVLVGHTLATGAVRMLSGKAALNAPTGNGACFDGQLAHCQAVWVLWCKLRDAYAFIIAVQMRMMALVALCAEREGTDVSFEEVSKSLQLQGDEAEAWIVRAFGKQLLDGRIDQVCHHVLWKAVRQGKKMPFTYGMCLRCTWLVWFHAVMAAAPLLYVLMQGWHEHASRSCLAVFIFLQSGKHMM